MAINSSMITIDMYTDGSCKKNGNNSFGAWAFIATRDNQAFHSDYNSEKDTTNQRMELTAVLKALQYAKSIRRSTERVVIYSDSAYIVNCFEQEWYVKWMQNGWYNSSNQPVANADLWEQIIPFFDDYWYDFKKTNGHSGIFWNEQCDRLAQQTADQLKKQWRG